MQFTGHTSTHCGAVEVADALGALVRIDDVDLRALRDRLVRAFGLADVAVDALVGDDQGHEATWFQRLANFALRRASTAGCTNEETSPPNFAISRTIVAEMKVYCSDGVRKSVSTSGKEVSVHSRHLEFVFEVGHRADSAQDHAGILRVHEVHQQPENGFTTTFASGFSTSRAISTRRRS
jgi:hypothetical protein